MKNILNLSTAADIQAWADYFLVVKSPDIAIDPTTGLNRAAIVKGLEIYPDVAALFINVVLYILETDGTPINATMPGSETKNIFPVEIRIPATNDKYINIQTLAVTSIAGLTEGVDYLNPENCESISTLADLPQTVYVLPEFEAYRVIAKSNSIDLFALMTNAIITSTRL